MLFKLFYVNFCNFIKITTKNFTYCGKVKLEKERKNIGIVINFTYYLRILI